MAELLCYHLQHTERGRETERKGMKVRRRLRGEGGQEGVRSSGERVRGREGGLQEGEEGYD